MSAASQLHLDRFASLSSLGYALAIPAAFLCPFVALALIFLITALARTILRRVLTPSRTPQGGSILLSLAQDANPLEHE
jgi:hypothetical protein